MKDDKPTKGGRLSTEDVGAILFSMGSYVGETILRNLNGGEWLTDDQAPQSELKIALKLPNESIIFPIQKVFKRFRNGKEDSIYPYIKAVTQDLIQFPSDTDFWNTITEAENKEHTVKKWWKFW